MEKFGRIVPILPVLVLGFLWFVPAPEGVSVQAWHLFALFGTAVFSVVIGALPVLTASVLALALSVLTGTLEPAAAYAGFSESFILLIVVAFLVAQGVVQSGLAKRFSLLMISRFGKSSLGLGYSMVATDILIAPAFPSNTARSGVLFPIANGLALDSGSKPDEGSRRKIGAYLMMNSIAGLSISSGLWFTAMAANPVGAAMAEKVGVEIGFGSWLAASCVPALACTVLIPWALFRVFPPDLRQTPDAPGNAKKALSELGPFSRQEWITALVFAAMVITWAMAETLGVDKTAVAFAGLGVLMVGGVFTPADMKSQGEALSTYLWFAILYTMSAQLDALGFMTFVGEQMAAPLEGLPWPAVYVLLTLAYVLIHYLFVSQTAQMLALFSVFLTVGIGAGVPAGLLAMQLLFATNYNSSITPQGSSANILFASSGYLTSGELYRLGALCTGLATTVFLTLGTAWMLLIGV